jgi:pyruvate/2-oxoglutarate dehydrogenase complex dihydrolipoamide dehydrogenase (E3) component
MPERADVIVMGAGTAGEDLSLRLIHAGLDVVGIEPNLVGGECPFWAWIPSKFLIRLSNLIVEARRVNGVAGTAEVTPDWLLVASRLRAEATGGWDDAYDVQLLQDAGGRFVRGYGQLTRSNTVAVGD